jgi:hypothetical protein
MLPRAVLLLLLGVLTSSAARADDCDDITPVQAPLAASADRGEAAVLEPTEVVVPCAVVDDGFAGADCADAFYVVNHQGTLLCRVEVLAFAASSALPCVEGGDPATSPPTSPVVHAVVPTMAPSLRCPLCTDVARALPVADAGPANAHVDEQPRPS